MEVQSLNLCVPAGCPNRCKFCVSQMHENDYPNLIEEDSANRELHVRDFKKRLQFARDNDCNIVILTGIGEPLGNRSFLQRFGAWNGEIPSPFKWIEVQTSGVFADDATLAFVRETVEVTTVSLSMSNMLDDDSNAEMNGTPPKLKFRIEEVCRRIKAHGFNLRLALNMNSVYNSVPVQDLIARASALGANQVTFKKLYAAPDPSLPQTQWIVSHEYSRFDELYDYIRTKGRALELLPYGWMRYSLNEMSIVVDSDCMATEVKPVIKYLILRPDCRLYTKWDDRGSLLF